MNGLFKTKEKTIKEVVIIEISLLCPNKSQPRKDFNEASLMSLSDSIKENGILQPVCVRKNGALYEIISGERRTRAAKLAGLTEIPCIVMDVDDEQSAVLALIENIQRKDLSYIEEALAIEKLISVYGLTQENAAARLGKAQSTIANKLRLLRFSEGERGMLAEGNLSERQARSIIRIADEKVRQTVLEKVIAKQLNLEQTEQLVSDTLNGKAEKKPKLKAISRNLSYFPQPPLLYVNSINQLIRKMKDAKIPCETVREKKDGYYQFTIRFPETAVETRK